MTPLQTARGHVRKAQEFLEEAEVGETSKAADHAKAVPELRRAGRLGAELAPILDRLLRSKTRSQYQSVALAVSDAEAAVRQARRLVEAAVELVAEYT